MPDKKVELKVRITLEDYRDWNLNLIFTTRLMFLSLVILIFMLLSLSFSFLAGRSIGYFMGTFAPVIGIFAAFVILLSVMTYINAKKMYDSDKLIQEEQTYAIDTEAINTTTNYSSSRITWDKIYRVTADKKYICVYLSKMRAFLLPKKCFTSAADINTMIEIIKEKMDKKKIKISK